jgi:hypothetical protein
VRELPFIAAVYHETDDWLDGQRTAAEQRGDGAAAQRQESKQRINDQAFFILCWGQLESAIDDTCRDAIRQRRGHGTWAVRRGWDIYNPNDDRLSGLRFEHRTALVLDQQAGHGSPWAKVMSYYAIRNQIAHGKLVPQRIDIQKVVQDLFEIQGALQA